jgi:hypothetical protein
MYTDVCIGVCWVGVLARESGCEIEIRLLDRIGSAWSKEGRVGPGA